MLDFQKLSASYQQALLRQVVPFWLKHSRDNLCGGYFDLLTATGEVIEGDKFVSLQAQQVWAFSWLYNTLDGQLNWLEHAKHGAAFLSQFAHDDHLVCYDQLDRRGRSVAPASSIVSDSFAVMAYVQIYKATGDDEWAMLAKQTFSALCLRRATIRDKQVADLGGFRSILHVNEPATFLKTVLEMKSLLDEVTWRQLLDGVLQELLYEFTDRRTDILRESILPEGAWINTPEGRRLNVGLTFQTASYLFDLYAEIIGSNNNLTGLITRKQIFSIVQQCLQACQQAWDEATAGLNQYIDTKGQPFIFPDWQQKWAWVHTEAIAALVKGYIHTRHADCLNWFKRIHDFTFQHFPDLKYSGWHLALDSYNQPLLLAKSIPSVGCFSLVRCLTETAQLLSTCEQLQSTKRTDRTNRELSFGSKVTRQTL